MHLLHIRNVNLKHLTGDEIEPTLSDCSQTQKR